MRRALSLGTSTAIVTALGISSIGGIPNVALAEETPAASSETEDIHDFITRATVYGVPTPDSWEDAGTALIQFSVVAGIAIASAAIADKAMERSEKNKTEDIQATDVSKPVNTDVTEANPNNDPMADGATDMVEDVASSLS